MQGRCRSYRSGDVISMKSVRIQPSPTLNTCTFSVPGDKSISHRVAMMAGMGDGISTVRGFLLSEDCMHTLKAMEMLGAEVLEAEPVLRIKGHGGKWKQPEEAVYLGNSGTSMRLLSGVIAGAGLRVKLTGDASLSSRDMTRVQKPLEQMGAAITLEGLEGKPPIRIEGRALHGIDYQLPIASAQVKSLVLLAGLAAEGVTTVREPTPTRDHTERVLQELGLPLEVRGNTILLHGAGSPAHLKIRASEWVVPGDISSAAFWLVAGSICKEGSLTIQGVGLNPRRAGVVDVLRRMGARLDVDCSKTTGEPMGSVSVSASRMTGTVIEGSEIPNVIDEIPILCVAAAFAEGETRIRDAGELRHKESDRIALTCQHLRAFGVNVVEHEDGMTIVGNPDATYMQEAPVHSNGDHRMAMACAVLAMRCVDTSVIQGVDCINTSYPNFWQQFEYTGGHYESQD